ncbi:serine/arginine repetitive matrix protein 1-like isoform X7 [Branchiostoma floridae]|uniref:non-specific serine/threonine protein kinase n=1 Tax=Branchiostoma floridae TaxID=7739 RepID=A0A9J7L6G3_BRAFL|nr:serine/arginine repetitive matrix protein 1-like isoform X7 [Branchiostoma floridae]
MASLKHAFPFYDKDINNLALKIVKGKMGPLYNSYSRDLVDLIKDMLQIEPDQRPTVRTILRTKFIKKHVSKFLEESIRDSYGMRCDVRFPTSPAWDEYNQYRFPSPPSSPTPGDSEQSQEEDTPKKRVVTGPLVDMEVKTKETAKAKPFGAPVRVPPSSDPVEIPRKRAREEPPEETIDDDDDDIDNISQTSSEVELMRLTEEFLKEAEGPASPVPSPDLPPPPTPRSARIIAKEAPDLLKKKPREDISYSSYVRKNLDHKVAGRGRSPPREKEGEEVWSPTRVVQRLSTPSPVFSAPPALPPPPKQPLLKSASDREKSTERRRQHEMEHSYAESSSRYSVEVKKPGRASPAVSSSRESDRASPHETQRARQDRASPAVSSSRESNRSSPFGTQGSPRARQGRSSPQMEDEDSDPRRVSRDRHIASDSGGKSEKQDRYSPLRRVEQEREDHTTEKHTRGRLSNSKSPARAVKVGEYSSKAVKVSTKVQIYHAEEEEGPQRSPSQDSGLDSIEEQVTKLAQEYPAQPETNEPLNRSLQSPLTPTGDAYDWRMHVGGTLTLAERSGEFSEVVAQIEREEEEERATSTRQEKAHASRKGVNAASLKISLSSKSVTQKSMSQEFDNSKLRSRLSDVSRSRSEERLDQVPKVPKISEPRQVPYTSPMVNRKVRKPRYEVEEGDAVVLKSTLESSVLTAADVIEWSYVKKRTYSRETVYQIQSSSKVAYGLFRGRVSIEGTAALRIFPAKPQDTGRYYCTARDVDGNESEGYLELIVEAVDKRRWSAPADMRPAADLTPTPTPPNTPVIDGSRSPNVEPAYPKPDQTSREVASPTVVNEIPRRSPHHKPSIILEEKEGSSSEEEQDKRRYTTKNLSPPASVVSSLTGSATDLQLMIAMKEREREKEREKERDRDRRRQSPSPMGRRRESPSSPARRASPSPGRSSPLSSRGQSPEVRHAYTPMVTPPPIPAPPVGVYLTKASPREDFKVRGRSSGGSDKVISPTSVSRRYVASWCWVTE